MNTHFVGSTHQGVSWFAPKCPICGLHHSKVGEVIDHFSKYHSFKMPWWAVTVEDKRSPGNLFHFIVDDIIMAKQLNGVAIPLEPAKEPPKPRKPIRKAYTAPPEPKKRKEEPKPKKKPKTPAT